MELEKEMVGFISIDKMKKIGLICFLLLSIKSFGQQETQYTQYMYNLSSINPGALAMHNEFKIFGSSRYQWAGVKGAPLTQFLSIESPIDFNNLSLGANIISDRVGPLTETEFVANVAYQVPLFEKYRKLSLGLRVGGRSFNIDWTKGDFEFDDPVFRQNVNEFVMTVGAGIYYEGKHLFGGIAVNNLLPNKIKSINLANEVPHYNIIGGYNFIVNDDLSVKPMLFTSIVDGGALKIEGSTTFNYQEKYFGGLSYRLQSSMGFIFGMQVTPKIRVGYSYDVSLAETSGIGTSSHELLAVYTFKILKYKRENRY
ncbi:PorP/SprF family type IX secretion system membrane protein [Wenyingzhuangia sp. IMCC45574]